MTSDQVQGRMDVAIDFAAPQEESLRDSPPRCMSCGHDLTDSDPQKFKCRQCGRTFNPHDRSSFTYLPPYEAKRMWLPGAVLAVVVAAFVLLLWGVNRVTVLAALLAMLGVLLGYGHGFVLALVVSLVMLLIGVLYVTCLDVMRGGGSYKLILPAAVLPVFAAALAGILLRQVLKHTRFEQRWYLP